MGDLMFVVKSLVITVVIVFMMQIKVGDHTLEQRSVSWIHTSSFVGSLQSVADGAIRVGREGYELATEAVGSKSNSQSRASSRSQTIQMRRSEAIERERERAQKSVTDENVKDESLITD